MKTKPTENIHKLNKQDGNFEKVPRLELNNYNYYCFCTLINNSELQLADSTLDHVTAKRENIIGGEEVK